MYVLYTLAHVAPHTRLSRARVCGHGVASVCIIPEDLSRGASVAPRPLPSVARAAAQEPYTSLCSSNCCRINGRTSSAVAWLVRASVSAQGQGRGEGEGESEGEGEGEGEGQYQGHLSATSHALEEGQQLELLR